MAQQFIEEGMSGTDALNVINDNFTELYDSLVLPMKFPVQTASFQAIIPANTMLVSIDMILVSGGPVTVNVGDAPNSTDLINGAIPTAQSNPNGTNQYFAAQTTLYFTLSGTAGSVSFRLNVIENYF